MDFEFKEVTNLNTGRKTYFIDNKKVSYGEYCLKSISCDIDNFKYNTSYIYTQGKYRRSIFHYTKI